MAYDVMAKFQSLTSSFQTGLPHFKLEGYLRDLVVHLSI